MAGSRNPGPLGRTSEAQDLNDGTMIRGLSPRPGPVGTEPASIFATNRLTSVASLASRTPRRKSAAAKLQVLRQGSRGPEVQKLQRQLNARLTPSPKLVVDGVFGPLTLQVVLQYQKSVSIAADGIVGKQTWYHLLKGDKATVLQSSVPRTQLFAGGPGAAPKSPTAVSPPQVASPPVPVESIWEWPLEKKLLTVLERVPRRLPGRARDEFMALLQSENLALSLVIIAGFCLLSGGTALVLGVVILGFDITLSLASALQTAAIAATEDELDEAADELAHIVLAVGVAAFIKGVGRIAKGVKGGGKSIAPEAPPKPVPSKPQLAKPQPVPKAVPGEGHNAAQYEKYKAELRKGQAQTDIKQGRVFNTSKMSPHEKDALKDFNENPNAYHNAKRLSKKLAKKRTAKDLVAQMENEAASGKCTRTTKTIKSPDGGTQEMAMYEYPDGTIVRVKPKGDGYRNGTTYSVEGKHTGMKNPDGTWKPDDGSKSVTFKVDEHANAVSKNPDHVNNPYDEPYAHDQYDNAVMDAGHKGPLN